MKRLFHALIILLLCSGPASAQVNERALPIDGYAAIVNDRIITIGDVMDSTREAEERLRVQYSGDDLEARRKELFQSGLERLIDQALILEEFKKQEGQMPERAVTDYINDIVHENFNGDRSALLDALAKDQVTMDEWRETIRERLIVSAMRRNAIGDRVVIPPRQIREAYEADQERYHQPEEVNLRMIFVRAGTDSEKAFAAINDALAAITNGADFAAVAKEKSDDSSAVDGGAWGWLQSSMLREELKKEVDTLSPGQVSPVIHTTEGFYLLKLEERRAASTRSFEDVRQQIEKELRENESERLYKEWMARLRQKFSVIYYIPNPPSAP